jgi:hypothetical protein
MVSKFSIPVSQKGGIIYVLLIVFLDWAIRKNGRLKPKFVFDKKIYRWIYVVSLIITIVFGMLSLIFLQNSDGKPFIYFQF